jgi:hypothetical protein
MTQLAWFGGVALFFVTLIFPIQFDRQWITLGWWKGGAVVAVPSYPHAGLQLTGVSLLVAAFVRRPEPCRARISSAQRDAHSQLVSLRLWHRHRCLFVSAWLLAPPRDRFWD